MMAAANVGSCAAILEGIPQVKPNYAQTVPAMHQSLSFSSTHVHLSFNHPYLQVSYHSRLETSLYN